MKKSLTVFTTTLLLISYSASAIAECRRVTPAGGAFGIDSGSLCSFGGENERVLPDYGYGNSYSEEAPLYSYKEQRAMLKSQVQRGRRGTTDGLLQQSVNSAYRPLGGISRRVPLVVRGQ